MRLSQKPQAEVPAYTGEGVWPTQIVRGDTYYNKLQEINQGRRVWYVQWSKLQNDVTHFVVMWIDSSGRKARKDFPALKGMYSRGWDLSQEFFYSSGK